MHSAQDRLVIGATVISESAWMFALLGVMGLVLAKEGSPLSLLAVLVIMSASLLTARFLQMIIMPAGLAYTIQMLVGVIVLYLTIGSQVATSAQGIDLGWIGRVVSGTDIEGYTFTAAVGSILGAALWWRGGMIAAAEFPADGLGTSFRLGVLAVAIAAVVDIAHPADLHVFPVMFLFFAAGLAGLSIGHVLPASQRALEKKAWPRVIGGVVLAIVVIGLLFSMLQRNVLAYISAPALFVLNILATIVFYVIIVPIAFVVGALTQGLLTVLGWFASENVRSEAPDIGGMALELQEGTGEVNSVVATLVQVAQWVLVALIVLAALYIIAKAFRRRLGWRLVQAEGTRESVKEDADAAYDLKQLLLNLLPRRFRAGKQAPALRLPDDDAEVVEVFRVYYGLLSLAEDQGFPKPPAETPREYQHTLEQLFPRGLARLATAAFTRACYGHHPAPREQIEEMKASLARLQGETG